jgi:hypothetical protein
MKKIDVTEGVFIEALGPDEAQDPIVYLIFDDFPERQSIPVYAREIRALVAALAEAAGWIAENWTGVGQ